MPHYSDGSEAKSGDLVIGQTYNVPHRVIGVVSAVRAGDACNADVVCLHGVIEVDGRRTIVPMSRTDAAATKNLLKSV